MHALRDCTCTYGAYALPWGGTGWDVARYDPDCSEHGSADDVEAASETDD